MDLSNYNSLLDSFDIKTPIRRAAFYAQIDHESQHFTRLSENLNYSIEGLLKTWPSRFTVATAKSYARNPEKIANLVYANRMGNGNESSGDGWKFRGAGFIQLTGKDNQLAFASFKGISLNEVGDYLRTEKGAMESACWFWKTRNLNVYADAGKIDFISKIVNGGTVGISERRKLYEKYLTELCK
jgi:putative chitinase